MSHVVIRLASEQDAATVQAIYEPYVQHTPITFELSPPTVEEFQRRITRILEFYPWLVYEKDGQIAGYAYASRHAERAAYDWSVTTAVYLDAKFHRQGIGRALYTSLFTILKRQGFIMAYAGISLPNPASVGLHESLGFRSVGVYSNAGFKHGQWVDVGWWQREIQERPAVPESPKPITELKSYPLWESSFL